MQLRVARHTERLDEVVAFYRDGIGLTETGGFRHHDGYDGVFLAVPGTGAHLELTAGAGTALRRRIRNHYSCSTWVTMRRCTKYQRALASIRSLPPTHTGLSMG